MDHQDRLRRMIRATCAADFGWAVNLLAAAAQVLWPDGDPEHEHDSGTLAGLAEALEDISPRALEAHERDRAGWAAGPVAS